MTQILSRKVRDLYRAGALDPYLYHMSRIKTSPEVEDALGKFVTAARRYTRADSAAFYSGFNNLVQLSKQKEGNVFDDYFSGRISESDLCRLIRSHQLLRNFASVTPMHGAITLSHLIGQSFPVRCPPAYLRNTSRSPMSDPIEYRGRCYLSNELSGCYATVADTKYFFSSALIELQDSSFADMEFAAEYGSGCRSDYHFSCFTSLENEKYKRRVLPPHTLWRVVNDRYFSTCFRKIEDPIVLSDQMLQRAYSRLCVLERLFGKTRVMPSEECRRYELEVLGKF